MRRSYCRPARVLLSNDLSLLIVALLLALIFHFLVP